MKPLEPSSDDNSLSDPAGLARKQGSAECDVTEPRPNPAALYQCGLLGIGSRCALGPTPSGRCCQEQWIVQCDDQTCQKGCAGTGKCEVGQLKHTGCEEDRQDFLPCIPIKNGWHSRHVLAVNLAILTAGILLVCMALPNHDAIFAPGQLSTGHSQILGSSTGATRCATCHPNSHGSPASVTQEQLCMNCHQSHMKDAIHGYPHDLSVGQFASFSMRTRCSECHQEHHGDSRSLKSITDARCQSCHQQQFASFTHGHPEFSKVFASRPRRIAFDHAAHLERYFPQNNAAFDCSTCHQSGGSAASEVIRTVGFEQACASCHDKPLKASSIQGWALLQLPSLQASDPASGDPHLIHWPASVQYGYDGPITLSMRLLLSADSEVAKALDLVPEGDLSRINPDDPVQQSAARTIASAVRQLMGDTAERGQAAWLERLSDVATRTLGRDLSDAERNLTHRMVAGLPPDLFRHVESRWFPGSQKVVGKTPTHRSATLVSLPHQGSQDDNLLDESEDSSDQLLDASSEDLLLDVDVDELLGRSSTPDNNPLSPDSSSDNKPPAANVSTMGIRQLSQGGWFLDDQLFAIRYMPGGHADPLIAAWIQFVTLLEYRAGHLVHVSGATHADMHPSIEWQAYANGDRAVMQQCADCHLLAAQDPTAVSQDDWKSLPADSQKRFTRFDHRPHLTIAGSVHCQTCHQINTKRETSYALMKKADVIQSPGDVQAYGARVDCYFQEEFHSIQKSQCNSCHRAGGAPENCTQCHNYHVDMVPGD